MNTYNKRALITGITGQIGGYLAELLIEKGYEVYGITRKTFDINATKNKNIVKGVKILSGDLEDFDSIERIIRKVQPHEIYNLAAQSSTIISFELPEYTMKINGLIIARICETVKKINKPIKIYQAGSAEFYGYTQKEIINEETLFSPKNPYGIAKLMAFNIIQHYRDRYDMFCCNGIVFNSESPRRGENFVTRKIVSNVAEITRGKREKIELGNLNSRRDWIHAKDTAKAIWMMMQAPIPSDYIVASGEAHSIKEFVELAFKEVEIEVEWKGEGLDEIGYDKKTRKIIVTINPKYYRSEDRDITGDSSKLRLETDWKQEYSFEDIVKEMTKFELENYD